jgi:hypothetical protein
MNSVLGISNKFSEVRVKPERENTLQMIFNNGRNELKIYWKKKRRYFSSRR